MTGEPLNNVLLRDALSRKLDADRSGATPGAIVELDAATHHLTRVGEVRTIHFIEVRGIYFQPAPSRPKLVILPPVKRDGDCHCCSRYGACFRVCEGTTVHSVEGITVGKRRQVKRLGICLGDVGVEHRARGSSYVACSRAETTDDYCFMKSVDAARLGAIGRGKSADELNAKLATLAANQSPDAATLLEAKLYEPLLAWAEAYALSVHGTHAPWAAAVAAPAELQTDPMAEVDAPDSGAAEGARRPGKRPREPTAAELATAEQCLDIEPSENSRE